MSSAVLLLALWYFGVFFLWPIDAHAWGPAVHVDLALHVLANAAAFAPPLRRLLQRYPNDFIYGNLSADIILGKKFIDYYYHCHNWRVGLEVVEHAKTDAHKAFAMGYLCHLAADVVAHNVFVPDKLVRTYQTVTARHAYWELRYDLRYDAELVQRGYTIAKHYHAPNDALLVEVLRDTLFSFKTNKRIFNGLLRLQKHARVQRLIRRIGERSPLALDEKRAKNYEQLSRRAVLDVLHDMEEAPPFRADPAGLIKLDTANALRRRVRQLEKEGSLKDKDIQRVVQTFHQILNETLFKPEHFPDAEEIIIVSG